MSESIRKSQRNRNTTASQGSSEATGRRRVGRRGVRTRLHSASQRGEVDQVRDLLQGSSNDRQNEDEPVPYDVLEPDSGEDGDTPLHLASRFGHVSVAKELCDWGARINLRNARGDMPLHVAASTGNTSMIRFLLKRRAKLEARGQMGRTPLLQAAVTGQLNSVRLLVESGADMAAKDDKFGDTPLHLAAFTGDVAIVKFLVNAGVDINIRNRNHETALHRAASTGNGAVTQLLIGRKADVEARNSWGWTPLHIACAGGQLDIVKQLLNNRAMIEARDNRGDTPLHMCAWFGKAEIARYLIARRATVSAVNVKAQTPLHNAAWSGGPEVMIILIRAGVDLLQKDRHGSSALHLAAANAQVESFHTLVHHGCRIEMRGEWGRTPLHMVALGTGDVHMARFLLDRKANIEAKDERNGDTALHLASEFGKTQLVSTLLARGARIDAVNRDGDTPLHRAALANQNDAAKVLLERGAVPETKRMFDSRTALHVACANHSLQTARTIYESNRTIAATSDDNLDTCVHLLCAQPDSDDQRELVSMMLSDSGDHVVNMKNSRGETPLHLVCQFSENTDLLELMLDKGASLSATNTFGQTPIEIAHENNNSEFVNILAGYSSRST